MIELITNTRITKGARARWARGRDILHSVAVMASAGGHTLMNTSAAEAKGVENVTAPTPATKQPLTPQQRWRRLRYAFASVAALAVAMTAPAIIDAHKPPMPVPPCAPPVIPRVPLVEWDLPANVDAGTGSIAFDGFSGPNDPARVWFVTRTGAVRLFKFGPANRKRSSNATWKYWQLDEQSFVAGGVKKVRPSKDKRSVFIRTGVNIQLVDTVGNDLTIWDDRMNPGDVGTADFSASDLALDDFNNVYTTAAKFNDQGAVVANQSYLQKLIPSLVTSPGMTNVYRWEVGGAAGFCNDPAVPTHGVATPCLSGVAVDGKNNLIYYVEPGPESLDVVNGVNVRRGNMIAEINIKNDPLTATVRRWSLGDLGVKVGQDIREPRQISIDDDGTIWCVTGSGHLVRLIVKSNQMSAHPIPEGSANDPFATAPDSGLIGYTATDTNKVGMLFPKNNFKSMTPLTSSAKRVTVPVPFHKVLDTLTDEGTTPPHKKTAPGMVTPDPNAGTFVEVRINEATNDNPADLSLPSNNPLGIAPDLSGKTGSFFYGVGFSGDVLNRIGLAILPLMEKPRHARDDDDDDDHDHVNGCTTQDHDDDDNDKVGNKWDSYDKRETRDSDDNHQSAAGETTQYQMTAGSDTVLLIAEAKAADLGTPLKVEILNPSGVSISAPVPTPGVAAATAVPLAPGIYTVKVTNLGVVPATISTDLVVRALPPPIVP